ncbi:MAG: hypothetical protein KBT51_08860 [Cycloclasticus sp.]|nr:hypothetical protein [Cycloclasticus sp.]
MDTLSQAESMGFLNERPQGIYTKIKLTSYTNGLGECVYTKLNTADIRRKKNKKENENDDIEHEETSEDTHIEYLPSIEDIDFERDNKERSLRRARSTVRKKIIEGELDHLLTLTYKENMCDEKKGWADFQKFIRKLRKTYPNVKWVCVMEKQKRGAVHFHLAVHGFFQASTLRGIWLDVVYEGNIDIVRKKHNQSLVGLAGYLSKYLSKQKDNLERFGKMFRSSQNIKITELHFYLPVDVWLDSRISRLFLMLHERILTRWDSGNMGAFHSKFIASY